MHNKEACVDKGNIASVKYWNLSNANFIMHIGIDLILIRIMQITKIQLHYSTS